MEGAGESPLVTVITAAYNSERTVAVAMESVLRQSYANFEYIVINHGSTDGTKGVIEAYAAKDKRVKLLDLPENLGCPAAALNIAMRDAAGKYLCFLDADDAYKPDFIGTLLDAALQYHADVAVCSFEECYTGMPWQRRRIGIESQIVQAENMWRFLSLNDYQEKFGDFFNEFKYDAKLFFILLDVWWNKLYRLEFLREKDFVFPENALYFADAVFNVRIMKRLPRMIYMPYIGIRWTSSGNSTRNLYSAQRNYETQMYVNEHLALKRIFLKIGICFDFEEYDLDLVASFAGGPMFNQLPTYNETTFLDLCRYLCTDIPAELIRGEDFKACCQANALFAAHFALYFELGEMQNTEPQYIWLYRLRKLIAMSRERSPGAEETLGIMFDAQNRFSLGAEFLLDLFVGEEP